MLDLDIVLNYFRSLSPLPLNILPSGDVHAHLCEFYTHNLEIPQGSGSYRITDEFLFCGRLIHAETGTVILAGPTTEHRLSQDAIDRICKETGGNTRQLQSMLRELPQMSLTAFMQSLSFLNYILNENTYLFPLSAAAKPVQSIANDHEVIFHNTADFEEQVIGSIEYGRPDLIRKMLEDPIMPQRAMGKISDDSLRALKSTLVTSVTLAARAAIRGGLSYDLGMALSDSYLLRAEKISNYDDFISLLWEILLEFAGRTAELQLGGSTSRLVRQTAQQISGKLYSKITVEQLAQELNVSSSHLSRHFKKETGLSLTDYISLQKINEAKRLMKQTDLSLAQIAYQLSFSSQSYFHAVFKKVTGISPGRYPRD